MANFLKHDPNRLTARAKGIIGLVAAAALSLTGCSVGSADKGYIHCEGSKSITVEKGDTLTKLLVEHSNVDGAADARNVAIGLAGLKEFRDTGPLPDFAVPHFTSDSLAPGLAAGEVVDLPIVCTVDNPKS